MSGQVLLVIGCTENVIAFLRLALFVINIGSVDFLSILSFHPIEKTTQHIVTIKTVIKLRISNTTNRPLNIT